MDNRQFSPDGRWWWDGSRWVPMRRRGGARGWLVAGLVACLVLLVIAVALAAAARPDTARRAGAAAATAAPAASCSPQPCATDGAGWSVAASSVQYDAGSGRPFDHPEPGNVFVTVDVTFANGTAGEQHADPFNFVLQDGGGVKHPVRWTTFCPLWTGVNVTTGASYGPKCLAFEAVAGRPRPLTLVWTPGMFARDHPIPLT